MLCIYHKSDLFDLSKKLKKRISDNRNLTTFCYICNMKDNKKDINEAIKILCERIEDLFKHKISSPNEFIWLSNELNKYGGHVSPTTLKRIWQYLPNTSTPRNSSLSTLARQLGYKDFSHFVASLDEGDEQNSAPVLGASIHPSKELGINARLRLTWVPSRIIIIRHLGNGNFVVEFSQNSKLTAGDTFNCEMLIEGEPLYLDNLVQADRPPTGYVCGKRSGIHYNLLERPES